MSEQETGRGSGMLNMGVTGMLNDRNRPMKDYAMFDPQTMQPCIVRPEISATNFKFKPIMFQMLQTIGQFSGSPHEDPYLHLKQFLEVCSNFIIPGVSENAFRLKLFPYSLKDRAKAWLNSLEPNSITTWNEIADKFLRKFFPPIKNAIMRNDITSFKQKEFESLFEAWERWKELLRKCPHHGIPVIIQMEIFYNGLEPQTRFMLDASSGGMLLNLSYNEAYELIDRIATNSYSWPTERVIAQKKTTGVHEISEVSALSAQVAALTNMIKNLNSNNAPASIAGAIPDIAAATEPTPPGTTSCVYCGGSHLYEECPSNPISVNFEGYNNNNIPYSSTYNPEWSNHSNFNWSNNAATTPTAATPPTPSGFPSQHVQRPSAPEMENSLESLMKAFISDTREFMNDTRAFMSDTKASIQTHGAAIRNLENQVGQLATALFQRPSGSLASTTEASISQTLRKEQVNAISLRSGKALTEPYDTEGEGKEEKEKNEKNRKEKNKTDAAATDAGASTAGASDAAAIPSPKFVQAYPSPPSPQKLKKDHEDKQFGKFLEVLKQLHIIESSKESVGRTEPEKEGCVKEIEPEPDPQRTLIKQPTLSTQSPPHKNPTPQSVPQSATTTSTKTPPNQPILTPSPPKYTREIQATAKIHQPETIQPPPQQKPQIEVNNVVPSVATTSAELVNAAATVAVAKKFQKPNKGRHVLLSNSKLKVLPEKLKSKQSGPFKLVRVYPNGAVELFDEATNSTFKVNGKRVKQYYGAHVERDKINTELPEL